MVSCRCTNRITRDFRSRSSCEILRIRMASSICCRSIGWTAENMKKSQTISPIDMESSYGMTLKPPIGIEAEHTLVRVIGAVALPGPDQERAKREPRQESSDMSPPRDVSAGGWQQQPHRGLEQLKQEPETDEDKRIDFDE